MKQIILFVLTVLLLSSCSTTSYVSDDNEILARGYGVVTNAYFI